MAHDTELPGCFGAEDLRLAVHPRDQDRAFAWLARLRERGATWSEVSAQIEEYLRDRGAGAFHILDQVERAKCLFGPWLHDPVGQEQATVPV